MSAVAWQVEKAGGRVVDWVGRLGGGLVGCWVLVVLGGSVGCRIVDRSWCCLCLWTVGGCKGDW